MEKSRLSPKRTENLKNHFHVLRHLIEGYLPIFPVLRFEIHGDHTRFTLKKVLAYPYLCAGLFVLLFVIPFLMMIPSNVWNFRFWVTGFLLMGIAWIVFRFFVAFRLITVDTQQKILVLERKSIFKKSIPKPLVIPFHEFQELIAERKSKTINKFGQKVAYQRVYIRYKDKTQFLLDLPHNFQHEDDPETFIQNLEALLNSN